MRPFQRADNIKRAGHRQPILMLWPGTDRQIPIYPRAEGPGLRRDRRYVRDWRPIGSKKNREAIQCRLTCGPMPPAGALRRGSWDWLSARRFRDSPSRLDAEAGLRASCVLRISQPLPVDAGALVLER
jgi:hypothetical protein